MTGRPLPSALDLTRPQFDGHACVWCGIPLWKNAVSAGRATGTLGVHDLSIEVYACRGCADAHQVPAARDGVPRGRRDGGRVSLGGEERPL